MKLIIPDSVWQKIIWWINKSKNEVSGFGSLDYDEATGVFTVREAHLLDQEVAAASTEIKPNAIGKMMYEMRNEPNAMKWHWHSHVDMPVFWSSDDRKLIHDLGTQGWILATVINKKRETRTAFSTVVTVMGKTDEHFVDDLPTTVTRFLDKELTASWDKEFDSKVTEEKPPYNGHWDGYHWSGTPPSPKEKKPAWTTGKNVYEIPAASGRAVNYNHDEDGFRFSGIYQRWIYNPIYDTRLVLSADIEAAIKCMDDEEIDAACNYWDDKNKEFEFCYEFLLETDPPPDYTPKTREVRAINGKTEPEKTEGATQ